MENLSQKVRVRFAPSPTGNLHIGGMRTALFNWLFARHHGGAFLVRVEDTDLERSEQEYVNSQIDALKWCGIVSDESLIFQSKRTKAYNEQLKKLFEQDKVYRCICTSEEIEERVRKTGNDDKYFGYDEFCRKEKITEQSEKPFVVRFALPEDVKRITINDLIRGKVTFDKAQLDDFIIIRSDGSPTYNFVVVVDDKFMRITTVIRGDDHLSNTPKQILLYQACEFEPPKFAHIPLILNTNGQRLSKRDGAVDVLHYKTEGYLSDALVNYSVRLGWAHGNQEIFTKEELVKYFTLRAVGKKAAIFDIQKLQWLNSLYLKEMEPKACLQWLVDDVYSNLKERLSNWQESEICKAIELYKDRVKTGKQMCDVLINLHDGPSLYEKADMEKWISDQTSGYLDGVLSKLKVLDEFLAKNISDIVKEFCKEHEIKLVKIAQPLRIALIGKASSPGVFEILGLLGKTESIKRIHALQRFLESH